jgi:hypothetical protein
LPSEPFLVVAVQLVEAGLIRKVSKVLFMAGKDIGPVLPVNSAGVDSLVPVELQYWFLKQLHAGLAVANILHDESSRGLCGFSVERSRFWKGDGGEEAERAADEVKYMRTVQ